MNHEKTNASLRADLWTSQTGHLVLEALLPDWGGRQCSAQSRRASLP